MQGAICNSCGKFLCVKKSCSGSETTFLGKNVRRISFQNPRKKMKMSVSSAVRRTLHWDFDIWCAWSSTHVSASSCVEGRSLISPVNQVLGKGSSSQALRYSCVDYIQYHFDTTCLWSSDNKEIFFTAGFWYSRLKLFEKHIISWGFRASLCVLDWNLLKHLTEAALLWMPLISLVPLIMYLGNRDKIFLVHPP